MGQGAFQRILHEFERAYSLDFDMLLQEARSAATRPTDQQREAIKQEERRRKREAKNKKKNQQLAEAGGAEGGASPIGGGRGGVQQGGHAHTYEDGGNEGGEGSGGSGDDRETVRLMIEQDRSGSHHFANTPLAPSPGLLSPSRNQHAQKQVASPQKAMHTSQQGQMAATATTGNLQQHPVGLVSEGEQQRCGQRELRFGHSQQQPNHQVNGDPGGVHIAQQQGQNPRHTRARGRERGVVTGGSGGGGGFSDAQRRRNREERFRPLIAETSTQ